MILENGVKVVQFQRLCLVVFALSCAQSVLAAQLSTDEILTRQRELKRAAAELSQRPDRTDVVISATGETQTIIGQFDMGLTPAQIKDDTAVMQAVQKFILAHQSLFSTKSDGDLASWVLVRSHDSEDGIRSFEYTQQTDGLTWLSSEIVVGISTADATLYSISGDIRKNAYNIPISTRSVAEIAWLLQVGSSDVGSLRRGIEPTTLSTAWEYVGPHLHQRLDEETLSVYLEQQGGDETVYRTCSIRTDNWSFDGNGRISSADSLSGTVDHQIPCEGDEIWFSSNCTFKLRDTQHDQPLDQLNDGSDGDGVDQEYTRELLCTTGTPSFTSTSSNFAEQRKGFAWVTQASNTALTRLFSQVTPAQSYAVEFHTDWDGGQTGSARYDDFWHDIYFLDGAVTPDDVWHEYGHHVANMYGNFDNVCEGLVNEGDAIDESVGAMVSMLTLANLTPAATPNYGAPSGMGISVGEHTTTALVYNSALCGGSSFYDAARPFAQAFWEVLSNRDCSLTSCTASAAGPKS